MVDRVSLIAGLAGELPPLSASANVQAEKALNKVIALFMQQMPLAAARRLTGPAAHDLRRALEDVLTRAELKTVSKLWDPKRAVGNETSQSELAGQLAELLDGDREPFDPSPRPLQEARALDTKSRERLKDGLVRFASRPQLNAILKKWDRSTVFAANVPRAAIVRHLCELLQSTN
jgi:hypothetical protein